MTSQVTHILVAGLAVVAVVALFACALFPDPDENQRLSELKKREEAKKRKQREAEQARKDLMARGKHIHQIPLSQYKPSHTYLAPEKPRALNNVAQLRRSK